MNPSVASLPQHVLVPAAQFGAARGRGTNRQVFDVRARLHDMGDELRDTDSFYCPEWVERDFPDMGIMQSRALDPTPNVAVLVNRVRAVYTLMTEHFPYCSGVYIGKSSRTRVAERFSLHRAKVKGKPACVVLVTLATFTSNCRLNSPRIKLAGKTLLSSTNMW